MNLSEAISGRRAVREYTSQAVEEKTILHLIDSAVLAPSAVNQQPWTFTIVRDQLILDSISQKAKLHMLQIMQGTPQEADFRSRLIDPAFHIFYHAPVLILISAINTGLSIVEDCSLAAENLMLSAYDGGLGSCWIGFAQSYLNTPEGKALIHIPESWVPVAPIIVGHAKSMPPFVARKEPVIRWVG